MVFTFKSVITSRMSDTETPVGLYLRLRDAFAQTLLLEHAERFHADGGCSYICCDPIAGICLQDNVLTKTLPDGTINAMNITADTDVVQETDDFIRQFSVEGDISGFSTNGFFGHFNYDAIRYTESLSLTEDATGERKTPEIRLDIYRYILVFDHFHNKIHIVYFYTDEVDVAALETIEKIIGRQHITSYPFQLVSEEQSNFKDEEFLEVIQKCRNHCFLGDVFQVVLSREFNIAFTGDDFNVYRALRSINPSPYLFYFDYGNYRLFGSSPEAQLKIIEGKAMVHPIAGTYRRTGNAAEDAALAEQLKADSKENAEHVMLVDLARNDLSKNYRQVKVPVFKSIRQFSHVLHMVSEVTGEDPVADAGPVRIWADTFPAGTLSGAPKHKAMQLINLYEQRNRGFYGGSVGYIGLNGDVHHAIMIRSFLSKGNKLYYRAGAGVVAASDPGSELAEVNNKIAALRKAVSQANTTQL